MTLDREALQEMSESEVWEFFGFTPEGLEPMQ